jgi:iron complex transport system substrate-binding protein
MGYTALRNVIRKGATITLLTVAAVALSSMAGQAVIVKDATGRMVNVRDATRIVSVGGAITELLYALGQDRRIVAVDSTSVYPPQALQEKPNVGYMRKLSPEGVLGLHPSLILAAEDSGTKEAIAILESVAIPFVLVPDRFTGAGIVEKIDMVAGAVGATEQGRCLGETVRADLDALARLRGRIERPLRVMFVLSFVNGRAQVAGRATAADGIIRLAGAVNAIADYEGYKLINDESIIAAKPDFVLAMRRAGFALEAGTVFANAGIGLTPAARSRSFVSMEGHYLLAFGPRTALAARDLAKAFYPTLAAGIFPSERGTAPGAACRG